MSLKEKQKYRSWVEVDLGNFAANWAEMKRLAGSDVKILQVVKADAYGHGAIEISNAALKNGASFLGVANADEGVQLRVSGIAAPILILSPATGSEIDQIIKYDLTPSVSDLGFAREFQRKARRAGIRAPLHVEVDTGMGRGGTLQAEACQAIREITSFPNLSLEGIFTHFAESEILSYYNDLQWRAFREVLGQLEADAVRIPIRHISNSGAILNYPDYHLDMVRPGIMSYGVYPSPETRGKASLVPVMSFKTRVVLVKEFPEGYSIGYGRTFITRQPTRIATIPVGYGDGFGWLLSNQGEALIRGKRVPIAGRISMDMCTLDISSIPGCAVGDEVVLMGEQGGERITADEVAARVHSISYEILCALGKRAPRVFLYKGQADRVEPSLRRIFIPDEEKSIARIDSIIRHCFQTRARNQELGDAIYYEMFETLFGKEDRQLELRNDFRYRIRVSEFSPEEGVPDGDAMQHHVPVRDYFKVTTHVEYTKAIRNPVFLIGCARGNEQLAAFFEDKRCEYRWLLNPGENLVPELDFRVNRVRIDGEEVPLLRTENTERGYEVWCGSEELKKKLNRQVRVEIEIETKQRKSNRLFSAYLVYPTRGMEISFQYGGTGIKNLRDIGFFAGKHPYPETTREEGESVTLRLGDDAWIFPTSGVTFIWDI
ncbi:MAG: alanine racemase [Deltaproteobacteria bacterium]|nr:alanine racemase [Deltaproteobacteria bacterium]